MDHHTKGWHQGTFQPSLCILVDIGCPDKQTGGKQDLTSKRHTRSPLPNDSRYMADCSRLQLLDNSPQLPKKGILDLHVLSSRFSKPYSSLLSQRRRLFQNQRAMILQSQKSISIVEFLQFQRIWEPRIHQVDSWQNVQSFALLLDLIRVEMKVLHGGI